MKLETDKPGRNIKTLRADVADGVISLRRREVLLGNSQARVLVAGVTGEVRLSQELMEEQVFLLDHRMIDTSIDGKSFGVFYIDNRGVGAFYIEGPVAHHIPPPEKRKPGRPRKVA